jgi:hypothetical protein
VAQSEPDAKVAIAAAVVVDGRDPYAMYDVREVTASSARLRGPLLLEIGETFTLRISRGDVAVDVPTRVTEVVRREGHGEPELVVAFAAGDADKLKPIVG